MNFKKYNWFLLALVMGLVSCQPGNNKTGLKKLENLKPRSKKVNTSGAVKQDVAVSQNAVGSSQQVGSKLPRADKAMSLDNRLREISGLTFDASANQLVTHDDELGILYRIDFDKEEIVSEERIANIGDYEGVEKVGDIIYLINSAGEMVAQNSVTKDVQNYSSGLNALNNVEGLGYYNESLLIACKGKAEMESGQQFPNCRSIYSFSLASKTMSKNPFMLISKEMLTAFVDDTSAGTIKRLNKFAPSGIAVHPQSNEFYILSHKGKLLVVTNAQSEVQKIYFLDNTIHRQPEGICFDDQNRLYIANESNEGAPVIYRYTTY